MVQQQEGKQSRLRNIQDTVVSYAEIISKIAGVDVEVVDDALYRVAGTGLFAEQVNTDMAREGHVYKKVLETGKAQCDLSTWGGTGLSGLSPFSPLSGGNRTGHADPG
jgi:hypothetical protein